MSGIIVLDTNILFNDYFLNSLLNGGIYEAVETLSYQIIIPEVVIDELTYHYENRIDTIIYGYNKIKKELEKYCNYQDTFITIDKQKLLDSFHKNLKHKLYHPSLNTCHYPKTLHKIIVEKAIKKQKPFKKNGDGYRDSLLWENIKEIMNDAEEDVIFITNNTSDFFNSDKNNIHDELKKDLGTRNLKIFKSIRDCYNSEILPKLKVLNNFRDELLNSSIDELKVEKIKNILRKEMDSFEFSYDLEDCWSKEIFVDYVENLELLDVASVVELSNGQYLIYASYKAELSVSYFVDKIDAYTNNEASYFVEVYDWNAHFSYVSDIINMEIITDIKYNPEDKSIKEFNIEIGEKLD